MKHAGETVGQTGLYQVNHQGHRPNHQAILWQGETFPSCRICGDAASFQFLRLMTEEEAFEHAGYDRDFKDSVLKGSELDRPQLSA